MQSDRYFQAMGRAQPAQGPCLHSWAPRSKDSVKSWKTGKALPSVLRCSNHFSQPQANPSARKPLLSFRLFAFLAGFFGTHLCFISLEHTNKATYPATRKGFASALGSLSGVSPRRPAAFGIGRRHLGTASCGAGETTSDARHGLMAVQPKTKKEPMGQDQLRLLWLLFLTLTTKKAKARFF